MKAALGCAVCTDRDKDQWFIQLRVPAEATLFMPGVILTSTFGRGRDETIEKARGLAGVDEVVPWRAFHVGVVQQDRPKAKRRDGLIAELAKLEAACDALREEISKHHDEI